MCLEIFAVTLHRNGGAEAFNYKVPTNESGGVNPVNFALCGNDPDSLVVMRRIVLSLHKKAIGG